LGEGGGRGLTCDKGWGSLGGEARLETRLDVDGYGWMWVGALVDARSGIVGAQVGTRVGAGGSTWDCWRELTPLPRSPASAPSHTPSRAFTTTHATRAPKRSVRERRMGKRLEGETSGRERGAWVEARVGDM